MKAALKAKCSLVPLDIISLGFRINTKQLVRTELQIVVGISTLVYLMLPLATFVLLSYTTCSYEYNIAAVDGTSHTLH